MVNVGRPDTRVLDDDWTVVTSDGKLSCYFEHTVAITESGPEVLTLRPDHGHGGRLGDGGDRFACWTRAAVYTQHLGLSHEPGSARTHRGTVGTSVTDRPGTHRALAIGSLRRQP